MKIIISILIIIFLFFSVPLWAIDLKDVSLKELVKGQKIWQLQRQKD